MTHEYPRGLRAPAVQDGALAVAWVVFLLVVDLPAVRALLLGAIALVLGWGLVTLHFPSRIEVDEEGASFARYGRVHRFAWKDVTRVHVRRFMVRDRVFVRLEPSGSWRGRYWILDSMEGFERLVTDLERVSRRLSVEAARG